MNAPQQLVLLSVVLGVPIAALLLPGEWEKKARRLSQPWLPFGSGSVLLIVLGVLLVKLPLALAVFWLPPYLALSYFEFIPLRGENFQVFMLSYLLSLCLGKLLRYGYWRWALRGQLV